MKMKQSLLIITPRFPYPVVGGDRLRIYQICRALSDQYRLTLLSLCESQTELDLHLPDDGIFEKVERIFLPRWRSWFNCLLALPGQMPLQIAYYQHSGFRRRALELMSENDATLAHLIRVGDCIKNEPGIKFLEMTDAVSLNYRRMQESKLSFGDLRALVYKVELNRLRRYENDIVDRFNHSFLVSEIDRKYLFNEQVDKLSRVSVFSIGVAADAIPYNFDYCGQDIIFIGNMFSLQNFDAAFYMASVILPIIRRVRPNVRLRLIGRIKPKQASKLTAYEGVIVTGEVANVAKASTGGGIGVCPLRLGAGCQFKILEYMALGLPVVSTTIGLEGYDARPGVELEVADDASSFAAHVLRLIDDRKSASEMALSARKYIESHHNWKSLLRPMLNIIDQHLVDK
jgi:glycosyltransferase involved in cell wall biosynthesis